MEVHAHSHTDRKKFTHYLWEFLMLFLAVFCGFLAENYREHIIEHQREKQENHCQVRKTLQYIVALSLLRRRLFESQVIPDLIGKRVPGKLFLRWQEVLPEVLRKESRNCIKQSRQHAKPCRLKVQGSSPSGRSAQKKGQRQIEHRWRPESTRLAPIKPRMRENYPDSAHRERNETYRIQPMGDSY